ncbi:hypothetical protein [Clostridium sp. CCUG 7971]|uniref:hypothetical protein n=1 Tax=Clostridium sp. CCUG 7971 TaxID=2811414 RepID=UPI001ABB6CF6|nr:hypothetical protein [Clostridium sp. CCUG 7971]MBO3444862.1 hypothetical protein [Clostridium sp. CCUG 7971]
MKRKVLILMIFVFIIILVFMSKVKYSFKEDLLYSQSDLSNYDGNQNENNKLVSRQQAINIAVKTFKYGLNIDLTASDMNQYVSLYKNFAEQSSYIWQIGWNKKDLSKTYTCSIDSVSGNILSIYITPRENKSNDIYPIDLDDKEVLLITKKLTNELGIDLDQYNMERNYNKNGELQRNKDFKFINKHDENNIFKISIDSINKSIATYEDKSISGGV